MREILRINVNDIILRTIIMDEVIVFLNEDVSTQNFKILIERLVELNDVTDGGEKMLNRQDVLINNLTDFFTTKCAETICNVIVQNRIASKALCTYAIL